MKVKVNRDNCIGCGACVAIAPNTFDFNEDGLSTVINDELTNEVKEAEEACPEGYRLPTHYSCSFSYFC